MTQHLCEAIICDIVFCYDLGRKKSCQYFDNSHELYESWWLQQQCQNDSTVIPYLRTAIHCLRIQYWAIKRTQVVEVNWITILSHDDELETNCNMHERLGTPWMTSVCWPWPRPPELGKPLVVTRHAWGLSSICSSLPSNYHVRGNRRRNHRQRHSRKFSSLLVLWTTMQVKNVFPIRQYYRKESVDKILVKEVGGIPA